MKSVAGTAGWNRKVTVYDKLVQVCDSLRSLWGTLGYSHAKGG